MARMDVEVTSGDVEFGDDKFSQPSSFTFFQREEPTILGPNFKLLQRLYIVKLNLEMMFGDVLE